MFLDKISDIFEYNIDIPQKTLTPM